MDFYFKPILIKNFLSDEERSDLTKAVAESRKNNIPMQFKWWSRINNPIAIPESVLKKYTKTAYEVGSPDLQKVEHVFFRYESKYGHYTQLPPHQDEGHVQLSMDYQFDSNVTWPIVVEGISYELENNDILIFSGNSHVHWRPEQFLNEGEFVEMLMISFALPNYMERRKNGEFRLSSEPIDMRMDKAKTLYNSSISHYECRSGDQVDHSNCNHPL